jgi:hypothetical protein
MKLIRIGSFTVYRKLNRKPSIISRALRVVGVRYA